VVLSLSRYSYVVTRSRPYPARQSREVEAVSGWRLGTQRGKAARHPPPGAATRSVVISPLHFCTGRRPICTFARYVCLPGQLANWPTDQLINSARLQPSQYFHTITMAAVSSSQ
jgi:hypothetical protein